jgi:DNA-binding transcriptional LysR family regulator
MRLELQHLRQVLALAEHGSFVRAAAALHISQPALSRSIQNLEVRLGGPLFLRSRAGVVPTDAGRLYVERARELLRLADELDRESITKGTFGAGRVAVGGGPYPVEAILAPAALRFTLEHPRIAVQVRGRDWDELLHELRSRTLDFFVAETSTLQREADLDIQPMAQPHAIYLLARAGHPLALRRPVSTEEVLQWPFVSPGRVPPRVLEPMLDAHRASTRRTLTGRPFPSIQCNNLSAVKSMVLASEAVSASILSCVTEELRSGRLVLLGTEPWLFVHYGFVSLKGRPWTQAAARLRDLVIDIEAQSSKDERRLVEEFAPRLPGARRARKPPAPPAS